MAGARRYAAEVTEHNQQTVHASRQYAAEVNERGQRPWNSRLSYAESFASSRHQRASDPVGWSLLNSAGTDYSSSSSSASSLSVWENSYMTDQRRRRQLAQRLVPHFYPRQPGIASSSLSNIDNGTDQAESPPPSWQTQSLHGTQSFTNTQHSESTLSLSPFAARRFSAADISQLTPPNITIRSTVAGNPVLYETSSLADVDLWPSSSRRERDGTSFTPIFVEDIENDAEEITSTGAEAGSTASIGGDTESTDADAEVRSADFELGSIGAEVMVSGSSGSGAEIGVIDPPPPSRTQFESTDYGPSTSDMNVMSDLRSGSGIGISRVPERLVEYAEMRDRASQRRWRRFNQADLQDRASHHSSSAAAYNGSLRISDWLEFDWAGDVVPRRPPHRRDYSEFSDWNSRDRDTSAASDVPRFRDYLSTRSRRGRPPYAASGAASNSASYRPHECCVNCEICNAVPGRSGQQQQRHLSELTGDHTVFNYSSRTRPFSHETLAPAASAIDDDDSLAGALAMLQQEIETTYNTVLAFPWRESSASSVTSSRVPALIEFERRVRRLDERVSQMQQRMSVQAEREPRLSSLGHRLREQQDMLHSQLNWFRHHYRITASQVSSTLATLRNYADDLPLASSPSAAGGFVTDFVNNLGQ